MATELQSNAGSSLDVRAIRAGLGLSQSDFAACFGLSTGTLQDWEQGRRLPDGPARTLLRVIATNPDAVLQVVSPASDGKPSRAGGNADQTELPLESFTAGWIRRYPYLNANELQFRVALALIATVIESEFRVLARSMMKVSEGELRVLLALRRKPDEPQRPTELFRELLLRSSAGAKQLQRLARRRMIQKLPGPKGGRFLIRLTPKGARVVDDTFARSREAFVVSDAAFHRVPRALQVPGIIFLQKLLAAVNELQPRRASSRRGLPNPGAAGNRRGAR